MVVNETSSWYESSLPAQERKLRGHFSTPPLLVEQILNACGYRAENDLARLRVLDPACGSGNFLAGALRCLIAFGNRNGFSNRKLTALVQHNLWGFDPDPVSCFLAEMRLRSILSGDEMSQEGGPPGNTLVRRIPALHIHQADVLTLPWWQSQNVDLLIANPPYLAAKNNDLSGYRSTWRRGQADSYLLFLDLALRVVRPGGWIGLVVPDAMLARSNAAKERQRLLQETTVHHLWHLSGVFTAYVGAVVIIAQKVPPPVEHEIAWIRGQWQRGEIGIVEQDAVEQALFRHQPGAEMRYLLSKRRSDRGEVGRDQSAPYRIEDGRGDDVGPGGEAGERRLEERARLLAKRLHAYLSEQHDERSRCLVPLGELVTIRRGEELSKDSVRLQKEPLADGQEWYRVLRGGVDVRGYEVPVARYWIAGSEINKLLARYLELKLLVVKSTGCLQATLDRQGHIVLQTLYLLNLRMEKGEAKEDELYFLLALLNSRLLRTYVYILHTAYKWVQPQMEQHVLAHLPIPTLNGPEKRHIIGRAKELLHSCDEEPCDVELKEAYEELEQAICAFYQAALGHPANHEVQTGL